MAETCVFGKQSIEPFLCGHLWRPFFRSYGAILPSSLTKVLPLALVYSTHLPVSVYGTVSGLHRSAPFLAPSYLPLPAFARLHDLSSLVTSIHSEAGSHPGVRFAPSTGTGILTCYPSPAPFSLSLGPTNPTRTDLPSETLDVRRTWFSHVFRYSCLHSHFRLLQHPSQDAFSDTGTLPYSFSSPDFGGVL